MKAFEHDPRVVVGLMNQEEPPEPVDMAFRNYYLRGPLWLDEDGTIARIRYAQPGTGIYFPFGRGFVIGADQIVELPIFGYDPDRTIATMQALLDELGPPGDLNGDGVVGPLDLLIMLQRWGQCPAPPASCPADLDGNGAVEAADLLNLLGNWT